MDIFRQPFLLSTADIDSFFTDQEAVDNFYKQDVTLVDNVLKSIAPLEII